MRYIHSGGCGRYARIGSRVDSLWTWCSVPMDTSIASVIFRPGVPKYLLVVARRQMWDLPTFESQPICHKHVGGAHVSEFPAACLLPLLRPTVLRGKNLHHHALFFAQQVRVAAVQILECVDSRLAAQFVLDELT